jgi:hypothetical protein
MTDLSRYVVDPVTSCWEWQGYADSNGYGRVYDDSRPRGQRTLWAHRASFEYHKGPIPLNHEIDHTCQNTICINPDHLDAVTNVEHAARTWRRLGKDDRHKAAAILRSSGLSYAEIAETLKYSGRESAHQAVQRAIDKGLVGADDVPKPVKLTEEEREDVRALYALGVPQTELGAWYGIDSSAISRICNHLDSKEARRVKGMAA